MTNDQQRMRELERQLALVDRVLGLQAELAELTVATSLTPGQQLSAEKELARLRSSPEYRIGRLITAPTRIVRRLLGREVR